ncbi:MAG: hypothetical protein SGJ11_02565, partial [Phycisphaerae bacterium]|nr:hypothetical protein [Phycisphaerae bacterium]
EFSREGHGDGDDAVVKMPTPEKLCFFLQMNAIFGAALLSRRGCASAGRVLRPAESSESSSVTGVGVRLSTLPRLVRPTTRTKAVVINGEPVIPYGPVPIVIVSGICFRKFSPTAHLLGGGGNATRTGARLDDRPTTPTSHNLEMNDVPTDQAHRFRGLGITRCAGRVGGGARTVPIACPLRVRRGRPRGSRDLTVWATPRREYSSSASA